MSNHFIRKARIAGVVIIDIIVPANIMEATVLESWLYFSAFGAGFTWGASVVRW